VNALGFLWDINPLTVLGKSMSSSTAIGAGFDFEPVLRMLAWHVGISIVTLGIATAAVRRVHLRESGRGAVSKSRGFFRRRWFWQWKPTIGDHAMVWKEAFAPTAKVKLGFIGQAANVIVVVAAVAWTLYAFYEAATGNAFWTPEAYYVYTAFFTGVIGSGLLLLLAARASSLFTLEKERDTWVSLLSTPLSGRDIVLGKLFGNLYSARWGLFLMGFTWTLGVVFNAGYLGVIPFLAGSFLLCSVFVTSVGMLYSLHSTTSLRAMGLTLITVMFVGGGYVLCCGPVLAVVGGTEPKDTLIGFAPCLPFLMVAPAAAYAGGADPSNEFVELTVAYAAGIVLYLIVCASLIARLIYNFDSAAGRTGDMPDGQPAAPLLELVEE
jgi:ABC-type transport system involved in multi-copper enzyme maturation permease subunit